MGDFLKFFKHALVLPLLQILNVVWTSCLVPTEWASSIIVPLHKKGTMTDPNNFRGIALLSHVGKVLTRILNKRLANWVSKNKLLSDFQAGFRKSYSTLDNIFILDTIIQDRLRKKGGALYCCFVDLKKAFDWIDRRALFYKLHKLGLPARMLEFLKDYYSKSEFSVRVDSSKISESKKSVSGVFQGCQLSPHLFTLFINDIVDYLDVEGNHAPQVGNIGVHCLLYADDLVLIVLIILR